MNYFFYIFYRYYRTGPDKSIKYFRAITTPVFVSSFYILASGLYLDVNVSEKAALLLLIGYIIVSSIVLSFLIKERDLINDIYERRYKKTHGILAICFSVLGISLLMLAIIYN